MTQLYVVYKKHIFIKKINCSMQDLILGQGSNPGPLH